MPHLRDTILIQCPLGQTQQGLERFLASLRDKDGVSHVRLRVPVDGQTNALGLSIDREVRLEAKKGRDAANLNDLIVVSWSPEGPLVFPSFEGTLDLWSEENGKVSCLELNGSYSAPFGVAGQIFDAAVGHEIAQATARQFLQDMRSAIEKSSN
jgi:hypothetical protein